MRDWEGGICVPGVFRWPGVLLARTVTNDPTSPMDIYPIVVHLAGGILPQVIDGQNLGPLLQGRAQSKYLFHSIWKAPYVTPVLHPPAAGACCGKRVCPCFGEGVTHHELLLLFDLSRDPSEAKPLSADTEPRFDTIIKKIERATEEHRRTLTPDPEQLSMYNMVWKLWLQPCCGTFTFCW
uniref:Uncharacterized protein n=1 Tax=Falco tinnunculus TaxID=100819 RepID=A0A8C4XKL6_FALTI